MITIIDYKMGNLRSVQKGFEKVGAEATITDDPAAIRAADKVVLPGVGAFADAMIALRQQGLDDVVREVVADGKPFLGVCLGLQLLFDVSYEDGQHTGLGIISGHVQRFVPTSERKVPHMGWNQLAIRRRAPIFDGIPDNSHFYFVHSYYVVPRDPEIIAAETEYGGPFCSVIWRDNLYATQFHPEKSQKHGLRILENFARLESWIH
ncbi:MAG: imidazole glycerol phosphate synthase subunit HisH [Pirellulales bacterium]|nr:imidazole glycerol phosphate synthase subunit HisH [Pirellulales bacterium]